MKKFTDTRIKKANNVVSKAADMLVDFYNEELEKRHKVFSIKYLYLLKGISYIENPSIYNAKIVDIQLSNLPSIAFLENRYSKRSSDFDVIGRLSTDSKNRFVFKVTSLPYRKIMKGLPQCKKVDGGKFVLQNSLNVIKYLYIYIFLKKIRLSTQAKKQIEKLLLQARNKHTRIVHFYKKVNKANLIKTNPIKKIRYPSNIPLFYHQRKGIQIGCIMDQYNYVLEQRTGKTLINACIAAIRHERRQVNRLLIVGPLSCFKAWREAFTDHVTCNNYFFEFKEGSSYSYFEMNAEGSWTNGELMVSIINYESLKTNIEDIKKYNPDMVVYDEAHKISDKSSNQSKAAHKLSFVKYKYINTGTPIEGDKLQDMWSPYRFLIPDLLGRTYTEFSDKYLELGYYRDVIGYKKEDELLRKIHNTSYVLSYQECFGDDEIPYVNEYGSLGEIARQIYNEMDKELYVEVDDIEVEAKILLSKMIKLQQIAGGSIIDNEGNIIDISQDKLKLLYQVMLDRNLLKKKVVIFARYTNEIWSIGEYLKGKGLNTLVLTGKDLTGKVTPKEDREHLIHTFNTDKRFTVLIVQIKIAKESIDLSIADNEIFYSNSYSFKDYDQAKKRIRNANKTSPLYCINLIMEDTIDDVIMSAMEDKRNVTLDYFYENKDFK